ncbi:S41 family peptidase [Gilvimarinus polysaccharolyticus]|uniref:S41 family peptidase n=1 Tax=Gilvimarinus polysaccharolyticus TaxID=863921 RepID=UPI000A02DBF5|nr:S41 family peptidase [Gilvimarinus polysaccharolyticus]
MAFNTWQYLTQRQSAIPAALIAVSLLTLTACGGGGGGGPDPKFSQSSSSSVASVSSSSSISSSSSSISSSSSSSSVELTWTKGVYGPVSNYWDKCENPRTGIAPYNDLPYPDQAGSSTEENFFLRSLTHYTYLWYDEVEDLNPALYSTANYFQLMKTTATTPTGNDKDQFHWSTPTDEYRQRTQAGVEAGYGAVWALLKATSPREAVVSYVQPNSPAALVGLSRGARVLEIDGVDFVNDNTQAGIDTLNAGLFPSGLNQSHTFKVRDLNANTSRTIELTSTEITIAPTHTVKTINTGTGNVGYILFNSHIATAEAALINAIEQFRDDSVSDLVLDLRYNGGGYLDIANELAYMIAGSNTANKTFNRMEFNDQHPNFDPFTGDPLEPLAFHNTTPGFFGPAGKALPALNLNRLYVLTGPNTCSASEAIINGLTGIDVEVVQIGAATCGKPYGAYVLDNCGSSYFTVQFKSANAKGYGEYSDGFFPGAANSSNPAELPGCVVSDDYNHLLGDVAEARLAAALHYRTTGSCPAASSNKGQARLQKARTVGTDDGVIFQPPGLGDMILRR